MAASSCKKLDVSDYIAISDYVEISSPVDSSIDESATVGDPLSPVAFYSIGVISCSMTVSPSFWI